jgi:hypothetical protein
MYQNKSHVFVEHLNYSGIEFQQVNESKEPVNFDTGCYELDDTNFNLLRLTLPDDFDLLQLKLLDDFDLIHLKLPEEPQESNSDYSFWYIASKIS